MYAYIGQIQCKTLNSMRSTIGYSYSILIIRRQKSLFAPEGLEIVKRLSLTELHVIKRI